jgi:hypothetical protein
MNTPCEHHKTCGDCLSPNRVRTLEATIAYLANAMAEAAEWNLATLDQLVSVKSSSKSSINRQKSICEKMLMKCCPAEVFDTIEWGHDLHPKFGRVRKLLDAGGHGDPSKKTERSLTRALDSYIDSMKTA